MEKLKELKFERSRFFSRPFGVNLASFMLTGMLIGMLAGVSRESRAQVDPARDPHTLSIPPEQFHSHGQDVVFVPTGTISIKDDHLLVRDFPFLEPLTSEQRTLWLSENVFVLAQSQAQNSEIETHLHTQVFAERPNSFPDLPRVVRAYRPRSYGRALVLEVVDPKTGKTVGLLDVKGVGAEHPALEGHRNGLASFGECVREYLFEKLVARVLRFSKSEFSTVGTYGVGDFRFNMREKTVRDEMLEMRAGVIIRQASPRYVRATKYGLDFSPRGLEWQVEKVLRRFGITSSGSDDHGIPDGDGINVQVTRDQKGVLDFGAFLVQDHFTKAVYSFDAGAMMKAGVRAQPFSKPTDPDFIQPDPAVQVPFNTWGYSVSHIANPRFDNPAIWSDDIARNLNADDPVPHEWVEGHYRNMMGPVENRLPVSISDLYPPIKEVFVVEKEGPAKKETKKKIDILIKEEPETKSEVVAMPVAAKPESRVIPEVQTVVPPFVQFQTPAMSETVVSALAEAPPATVGQSFEAKTAKKGFGAALKRGCSRLMKLITD